ncbi:TPA: response regulator [Candidatus Galligastranaerophilus faecipullorum]|nr:response regulator [Candidatus Galligastranaerophilus faecipullorum]
MKKILIVEDSPVNMKLFTDILEAKNYDVTKTYDGKEAYEKIKSSAYDLMILDIQLPVLDGFSLLKKLKDENIKYPKTIIVSAFAMDKDKQTAKMLGCENYITKPIDIMNFLAAVEKLAK